MIILLARFLKQKILLLFIFIAFLLILLPLFFFKVSSAIAFSIASLVAYIIVFELFFRLYYRIKYKVKYKFVLRIPFKKMIFEPHPYLPYAHKKNFPLFYREKKAEYPLNKDKKYKFGRLKTNNFGLFNGPGGGRDIIIPKPKDMVRINCLGASTTGNYIFHNNKPYSYPLELETILNNLLPDVNLEVNNCGIGGYTSAEILIKFLLDIIDSSPDIIVIYHGYNDLQPSLTSDFLSDYSHSRRNLGEVYYLYELASKIPNLPLAFWNYAINNFIFYSRDLGFTAIEAITKKKADIKNDFKGLNTYKRNIEHIINICMAKKIKVVLSTYCHYLYPGIEENQIHLRYREGVKKENQILRELATKFNIALVDNEILIPGEDKYFLDSVHFSHDGMQLLAKNISGSITDFLKKDFFVNNRHD